jgi:DNA topoisomerase-3
MRRFAAVFCSQPCLAEKTEIVIDVGGYEEFTLKGTVIIEKGWTKFDDYTQKDKLLPPLEKGDEVNINFKPTEKETSPPKHYTIETLNNYLKNPFREEKAAASQNNGEQADNEEQDDTEDYRAVFEGLELGTEATRTGIINNAIISGYISLKKDVYTILPGGEFLIESLGRMNISMDKYKTAELGKALKGVFHGKMSVEESVGIAEKEIAAVFEKKAVRPELDTDYGIMGQVVGKCPYCGADFARTKFGYGCKGYREGCKFSVNAVVCGRVISVSNIKLALETGRTSKIEGFVSKNGKQFNAFMKLENGRLVFDF